MSFHLAAKITKYDIYLYENVRGYYSKTLLLSQIFIEMLKLAAAGTCCSPVGHLLSPLSTPQMALCVTGFAFLNHTEP